MKFEMSSAFALPVLAIFKVNPPVTHKLTPGAHEKKNEVGACNSHASPTSLIELAVAYRCSVGLLFLDCRSHAHRKLGKNHVWEAKRMLKNEVVCQGKEDSSELCKKENVSWC